MSIHRAFQLGYFPDGSSFFTLNDVPLTNEALVLWYYTFEDGINLGTTVCGYLVPNEELLGHHYFQSPPREDGSSFSAYFYDGNFDNPEKVDTFDFSYFSGFGETFSFTVHSSAMRYVVGSGDPDENGGGSETENLISSFNGHFATFKDGTPVKVKGFPERIYSVASSTIGLDDNVNGRLMINYNLIDNDGKVLLVPFPLVEKA